MVLKSDQSSKEITGNASKYHSYREAWTRIKKAQQAGFYIEALAIEESIISDRLISYLVKNELLEPKIEPHKYPAFFQLLLDWQSAVEQPIKAGSFDDLVQQVKDWSRSRNRALHQIVKSSPGEATHDIELFVAEAKAAAERGEKLAKAVSNWCRRQK